MHKKLKAELVSLANSILQMDNNEDVLVLHKKAQEIYEKLTVLKFVDSYLITSTISSEEVENVEENKPEVVKEVEEIVVAAPINIEEVDEMMEMHTPVANNAELFKRKEEVTKIEEPKINIEDSQASTKTISEEQVEELVGTTNHIKNDEKEVSSLQNNLEEELKDAVSADLATDIFEKVTKKEAPVVKTAEPVKKSLNDSLFNNNIQVGLNDRIAFVKYLFDGSQEDFNRVLSQLNSFKSGDEAKHFIIDFVKPDYDWSNKEEFEQRLLNLVDRKFA